MTCLRSSVGTPSTSTRRRCRTELLPSTSARSRGGKYSIHEEYLHFKGRQVKPLLSWRYAIIQYSLTRYPSDKLWHVITNIYFLFINAKYTILPDRKHRQNPRVVK